MISSDYNCDGCGVVFEAAVESPSPDEIPCPVCGGPSTWTPSPVAFRVRRVEVVRGRWEKPERKTYLDTRKLGEGQDIEEFRAEREKIWDEKRRSDVKDLLR